MPKSDTPKTDLKVTKDGSHTLYSHQFGQHYHNPNGAVAESLHNFFKVNGLEQALKTQAEITLLEIGFGTGLNLLLLLDRYLSSGSKAQIHFHSVEAYPISGNQAATFNYNKHLQHPEITDQIVDLFNSLEPGYNQFELLTNVSAHIFYGLFDEFNAHHLSADFIFHDAFSPDVNPELWSGAVFKKMYQVSDPDCLLTTYSTAARAKAALSWAGWKVAKTQGALGKREMIVASPTEGRLEGYKRIDEEHFARRYEQNDF